MDIERLRLHLLSLRGCTEDMPFGEDIITFRVLGKIFACLDLTRPDRVVLKSPPTLTTALQDRYAEVIPAWHWNKQHWIEVVFGGREVDALVLHLVGVAYSTVLHGLPKKAQIEFFKEGLPPGVIFSHHNVCASTMEQGWSMGHSACAESTYEAALVHADLQKNGRGQQGTGWSSQNGKNLTFTIAVSPTFLPPGASFGLLQTAAVALHRTVAPLLKEAVEPLTVKWPNDLYYGDRKLAGTLIQNDFSAGVYRLAAIGIGLNVNQPSFPADVPNPVSLTQILGYDTARFVLLERFLGEFLALYDRLREALTGGLESVMEKVRTEYLHSLYRREGMWEWRDNEGSFTASVDSVLPDGTLCLRLPDGTRRSYAFKEVSYALPPVIS